MPTATTTVALISATLACIVSAQEDPAEMQQEELEFQDDAPEEGEELDFEEEE